MKKNNPSETAPSKERVQPHCPTIPVGGQKLRHRAEEKLNKLKDKPQPVSQADSLRLLHELQVHQIELEMQNEELTQARAEAEDAYRQYSDLYDFAPVGYFTMKSDGAIRQVNLAGASLLGVERSKLVNRRLGLFVDNDYLTIFNAFLKDLLTLQGRETCEVRLRKDGQKVRWARLEATCFEGSQEARVVMVDITERKQAEQALRESEARYRTLLESTSDSIYVLDREWRHIVVNEAATRFVQMPKAKLLGNKLTDLFPGIEETVFFKTFQRVMETRESDTTVAMYTFPDGKKGWYEVRVDPTPEGILCISRDITDRNQTEEKLRESEEKYRQIVETAGEGIWMIDTEGNATFANQKMAEMLGFSVGEMLGMSFFNFMEEDGKAIAVANLERRRQGINEQHDFKFRRKDGTDLWAILETNPIFEKDGRYAGALAMITDITERKQAEEALRESGEKFRSYIQYAPDGVFISDEKGNYVEVNPAACHITGYSEDELLKRSIPDLLSAEDLEIGLQHFKNVNDKGFARNEIGFVTKSGEKRFWNVAAVKLSDTRFLGFVQDTTERKRAEEELKQSQALSKTIIDSIPGTFYMIDASGKYVGWNAYQRDEIVGQPESLMGETYAIDPDGRNVRNRHHSP